jgi:ppGpp synthetase/RelA/SpoT-type nucleotidyltranferase
VLVIPLYSKKAVSRAGDVLIDDAASEAERSEAIEVISNWRSSHAYPLRVIKSALSQRAKRIDKSATIARRLKRLSSIESKLRRLPNTRLAGMQDVAGCRAILKYVSQVERLVSVYEAAEASNPGGRSTCIDMDDYITTPKPSGYRGVHLIFRYQTQAENLKPFAGHKVEIQIRSQFQHYWATAVETAASFLGEALKADDGDHRWLRFFALASGLIAALEERPGVPGTPEDDGELLVELNSLWGDLQVEAFLSGCRIITERTGTAPYRKAHTFLIRLDAEQRLARILAYTKAEIIRATEDYIAMETEYVDSPHIQIVLVAVDSLAKLRKAYPNYYADTREFLDLMRTTLDERMGA